MRPSKKNLATRTVVAGERIYYIDAKEQTIDREGKRLTRRCVQITENMFTASGDMVRHKVMVYEDVLPQLINKMKEISDWMKANQ